MMYVHPCIRVYSLRSEFQVSHKSCWTWRHGESLGLRGEVVGFRFWSSGFMVHTLAQFRSFRGSEVWMPFFVEQTEI